MKRIILLLFIFIVSCEKDEIIEYTPPVTTVEYIFDTTNSSVVDGQPLNFNLIETGKYILLISNSDGVISRERFDGKEGINSLTLYTKVLPKGNSQLVLKSESGIEIYKTNIIIE